MSVEMEIEQLLLELNRETGIEFEIGNLDQGGREAALLQLKQLLDAYRSKYDREYLLVRLLTERMDAGEIGQLVKRYHMEDEVRRTVFVMQVKGSYDSDVQVMLQNLLYSSLANYVVMLPGNRIAVIKSWREKDVEGEALQLAHMLVDTMNTEAMLDVEVAYGTAVDSIAELGKSYQEACVALEIGMIFYMEQKVFSYRKLGVGRLIHELPLSVCYTYLQEVFEKDVLEILDEETILTIHAFFDAGLNVSEAARKLYIHRNTLVYRLEKLEKLTGLDIRCFEDAMTYKISAMVASYIHFRERENQDRS